VQQYQHLQDARDLEQDDLHKAKVRPLAVGVCASDLQQPASLPSTQGQHQKVNTTLPEALNMNYHYWRHHARLQTKW
jgi:hypothetical protein